MSASYFISGQRTCHGYMQYSRVLKTSKDRIGYMGFSLHTKTLSCCNALPLQNLSQWLGTCYQTVTAGLENSGWPFHFEAKYKWHSLLSKDAMHGQGPCSSMYASS